MAAHPVMTDGTDLLHWREMTVQHWRQINDLLKYPYIYTHPSRRAECHPSLRFILGSHPLRADTRVCSKLGAKGHLRQAERLGRGRVNHSKQEVRRSAYTVAHEIQH